MGIHKYIIRMTDSLLNMIFIIAILLVGAYCGYSLWDDQQIYVEAENVQEDMLKLKPEISEEEDGASFDELLAINEDVCAWLTLDNTEIDYPVLQGEDNLEYINKDVYGEFALAGSIYLDSRCDREFGLKYSLLYGHHMSRSRMFGDLELYKEKEFFDKNKTGILILPDRIYDLEIFSCMIVDQHDEIIFKPDSWAYDNSRVFSYAERNSKHLHKDVLEKAKTQGDVQILAMSTCSYEYDEARTIVLAVMKPRNSAD